MNKTNSQNGNALILILIAIAMFASLSWVFTQGSRQSSGALTAEQSRMAAQEIIAYTNQLVDTVQKLKLRGCANNEYDFSNSIWKNFDGTDVHEVGDNPTAKTGCGVFLSGEGNLQAVVFSSNNFTVATNGTKEGHSRIRNSLVPGIGDATNADLFYFLPHVKDDVCLAINNILGVTNPNGNIPTFATSGGSEDDYDGTFNNSFTITDPSGVLSGKTMWCAKQTNATPTINNRFRAILIAR